MSEEEQDAEFVARVARVNSTTTVILNVGSDNDVSVGDIFRIMSEDSITVTDPETGDELGEIAVVKARVKVTRVLDKMCWASTYQTRTVGGTGLYPLSNMFGPERPVKETMDAEITRDEADRTVRVGDRAIYVP